MPESWSDTPVPRILAHRGLARGCRENSLPAFRAALHEGATHLESDIQATRDGVAVLFHDADLTRTCGVPRRIEDVTLRELRELVPGPDGIPTLDEALSALPCARWNLDIKAARAEAPTVQVIRRHRAADRILIASFSERRSTPVARQVPQVLRSPGVGRMAIVLLCARLNLTNIGRRVLQGFFALQVPPRMKGISVVTPMLVSRYHAMGVEVHVWTVNDAAQMRLLISWGVDGIVTDRADLAAQILSKA